MKVNRPDSLRVNRPDVMKIGGVSIIGGSVHGNCLPHEDNDIMGQHIVGAVEFNTHLQHPTEAARPLPDPSA